MADRASSDVKVLSSPLRVDKTVNATVGDTFLSAVTTNLSICAGVSLRDRGAVTNRMLLQSLSRNSTLVMRNRLVDRVSTDRSCIWVQSS